MSRIVERRVVVEWSVVVIFWLMVLACGLVLVAGCAQNTETPQQQVPTQTTETPTATNQDAATQGSQVYQYIYVVNSPTRGDAPNGGEFALASEKGDVASLAAATGANGGEVQTAHGRYTQGGISISAPITTGGTAPTLTGTTTGTASAAQTPSQAQTVSPYQDIKPETSASVPIGVALPGGMVDQQAIATGKGQTQGTEKTSENQLTYQEIRAAQEQLARLVEALQPRPGPASQPSDAGVPPAAPPSSQPAGD